MHSALRRNKQHKLVQIILFQTKIENIEMIKYIGTKEEEEKKKEHHQLLIKIILPSDTDDATTMPSHFEFNQKVL